MRMIDVFNLIAGGRIEKGTKLKFFDNYKNTPEYKYEYVNRYKGFINEDYRELYKYFDVNEEFLNLEVELIPPKLKKYYLRLHGGTSNFEDYVNRHKENFGLHSYIIDNDEECNGFYTKFTQDEIDNDVLLKFIERHGIKEEVEEDEDD